MQWYTWLTRLAIIWRISNKPSFHFCWCLSKSVPISSKTWNRHNKCVLVLFHSNNHMILCVLANGQLYSSEPNKNITLSRTVKWHLRSFRFSAVSLSAAACNFWIYISNSSGLSQVTWTPSPFDFEPVHYGGFLLIITKNINLTIMSQKGLRSSMPRPCSTTVWVTLQNVYRRRYL